MMNRIFIFLLVSLPGIFFGQTALEKALYNLPDVIFKELPAPEGFAAAYELMVKQPLDHDHPEKGSFYQQVYFSHRGFDRPMVIVTEGYQAAGNRIYEATELLDANQLRVEHRFFAESTPEPKDWNYLNMRQACGDYHRIKEIFGQLYKNKWVSTGISKGGMTTIYYRYFYPDDVTVSIPYVAPLDTTFEDPRIYTFLHNQGSEKCRADIKAIQMRLLEEKPEALKRLSWYAKGKGLTYDYLGLEQAFEYAVLEYPFSFWQVGFTCDKIPDIKAPVDTILNYLNEVVDISFFSDQEIENYASHYYQAATETGYYGYETEPFKEFLKAVPEHPHAAFVPGKMKVAYNPTLSNKVYNWLKTNGNQFIYIYGATDTWTSAGVPPSDKVDALWFHLAGRNHFDARIKNFTPEERKKMVDALEKWLDLEIE